MGALAWRGFAWFLGLAACSGGPAPARDSGLQAAEALARAWGASRSEDPLVVLGAHRDRLGTHVRLQQVHRGIPVHGAQAVVHLADGRVARVTDRLRPVSVDPVPALSAEEAALRAGFPGPPIAAELRIVSRGGADRLAWRVTGEDLSVPTRPVADVDARTGELLGRWESLRGARDRSTHDAGQGRALPGALVRSEGQAPTGDPVVDDAHRHAGLTWAWYWREQGRDSWDGAGAPMVSTVRFGVGFEGAFWDGSQTVFGDGGAAYRPLAGALDVVAHEFTHGVVQTTAALGYGGEPGGVDEAWCDALAAAVEAAAAGGVIDPGTWLVGEDVTRAWAGGAIRSMADPTADGVSIDHYSDLIAGMDVHRTSGIANRAFTLAVEHPALDLGEAAELWYLALTDELTPTSDFAEARAAVVATAVAVHGAGSAEEAAVREAWDAVGVRDWQLLAEQGNLQAATGRELRFPVQVGAGFDQLQFRTLGGSGDADLFVRFGAPPTPAVHDCASVIQGSEEHCEVPAAPGTWYVLIQAYQGFSGLTARAGAAEPFAPPLVEICEDGLDDDLDGAADCADPDCAAAAWCAPLAGAGGSARRFTLEVPPGATRVELALSGGQGDAGLRLSCGSLPTTSQADCSSNSPGNAERCVIDPVVDATCHALVVGARSYSGVARTLSAR